MKKLIFISIFALIIASCSSDSDDTMEPPPVKDVTYIKNVKSIIDGNCISCHASTPNSGAPMSLVTAGQVKEAIENRNLIGKVTSGSMPPGSTDLSSAQIQLIEDWEKNSFK